MLRRLVFAGLLVATAAPAVAQSGDDVPRAYESLSQREKEREMQQSQWQGPSGMWTSPHKANGGAYRYRLMGIGAVLLLGTGLITLRLVKRANAARAASGSKSAA
jgi:hypothetical protein